MRLAALQLNTGDDVAANLRTATALLTQASAEGARLAVLPENFAFMGARETDKLQHAEPPGQGPLQDWLRDSAARFNLYLLGGTLPLMAAAGPDGRARKVFAASLLASPAGEIVARYDKIHLFDVSVGTEHYGESRSIQAGEPCPVVADVDGVRVGLSVCYDLRFPELYRAMAAAGAQILCIPSAFTQRTGSKHWDLLTRARAVENLCTVLAPNQCGSHPGGRATYGYSRIVDDWGDIADQCEDVPGLAMADFDARRQATLRETFPCLHHRRLL
jgi:deaminated glutathione amidase